MLAALERQHVAELERPQPGAALEHVAERRGDAGDVDRRNDRVGVAARRVDDLVGDAGVVHGAAGDLLRAEVQVAEEAVERPAAEQYVLVQRRHSVTYCVLLVEPSKLSQTIAFLSRGCLSQTSAAML